MLVRINVRPGYGDRFGIFHNFGVDWDAPDSIAQKLLARNIAVAAEAPEEEPGIRIVTTEGLVDAVPEEPKEHPGTGVEMQEISPDDELTGDGSGEALPPVELEPEPKPETVVEKPKRGRPPKR